MPVNDRNRSTATGLEAENEDIQMRKRESGRNSASAPQQGQDIAQSTAEQEHLRETALQAELENLQKVNAMVEGIIDSLQVSRNNMQLVQNAVSNSSNLLDIWTKILSQTQHNQRLILHPAWKGSAHADEEAENDFTLQRQEAERLAAEKARKDEQAARLLAESQKPRPTTATSTNVRGGFTGRAKSSGYGQRSLPTRTTSATNKTESKPTAATNRARGAFTSGIGRGGSLASRNRTEG